MKTLLTILILTFIASAQAYDYENMNKETYDAELLKWRNKLTEEEKSIPSIEAEIEELKKEIAGINKSTTETWDEIYAMVGKDGNGTKADFDAYMANVNKLRQDVSGFMSLTTEEAYRNRKEINKFQSRLDAFKSEKPSVLTKAENVLASIQSLIDQAREKAKLPNSMYQVERGDYLWKIAGKDEVYGDPYGWTRLYNSNKDQIKDPNLIFPKQVFTVARAVGYNEYLVVRGDNLFKIAQSRGSSFSWMKLYNANKNLLTDPDMIMPYQVIALPGN